MRFSKAILRTPLFKVSSLSATSTVFRIITGVLMSKLIAVFIGPSGLALLGNLRNFASSVENMVSMGFQNGIIKYVAEKKKDTQKLSEFMSTVFLSMVVLSVVFGFALFFLAEQANDYLFPEGFDYTTIIRALAFVLPVYAMSVFFTAVVNGIGNYRYATYISIAISLISFCVSGLLIWRMELTGALISIVIGPIIVLLVNLWYFLKLFPMRTLTRNKFEPVHLRKMSSYTMMAFVSLVLGPIVFLNIRNQAIALAGLDAAGIWEGISRLSGFYMMFLGSILTVYYLPKLSAAQSETETRRLFYNYYKGVIPFFALGLLVLYLVRDLVIQLLFTTEFKPMSDLFLWQLSGDLFKASSLILAHNFFAARQTRAYIISEVLSMGSLFFFSKFLLESFGIEGVVMAHTATYAVYLIGLIVFNARRIF